MSVDVAIVEASLAEHAAAACGAVRVDVQWLGIDASRLADGGQPQWVGDPCRNRPDLQLVWLSSVGEERLAVRPWIELWTEGLVVAAPAAAGQPVQVAPGLVPWSKRSGDPLTGAVIARRDLAAGDPVQSTTCAPAPDVRSGAVVTLRVQSGSLVVTSDGRALEDARIGESLMVRSDATDRALRGVLVDPGTVEIR